MYIGAIRYIANTGREKKIAGNNGGWGDNGGGERDCGLSAAGTCNGDGGSKERRETRRARVYRVYGSGYRQWRQREQGAAWNPAGQGLWGILLWGGRAKRADAGL
ncbi:hypothetical protein B0H12DRAFT_1147485 [Mycena haematopus]|nr:hypothetical protein B0H12DRAFT_1147485 [Mycena haematopus]